MTGLALSLRRGAGRVLRSAAALFAERRCYACSAVFAPTTTLDAAQHAVPPRILPRILPKEADPASAFFCRSCLDALPRREQGLCPHCGELAPWPDLPPAPCGRCLGKAPPWQGFVCHGAHEGLLRELLIRLKFQEEVPLAHALGALLAGHPGLGALAPDVVTPVPLHSGRLVRRGYNQALELARPLAKALRLPLEPGLLRRVRATPPQTGASRAQRTGGMKGAFAAHGGVRGRRVLLVDDTLTTGATLAASAGALLEAGAAGVDVAVMSRTPRCFGGALPRGWGV